MHERIRPVRPDARHIAATRRTSDAETETMNRPLPPEVAVALLGSDFYGGNPEALAQRVEALEAKVYPDLFEPEPEPEQ
ncbi:hypothetical protein CUW27_20765 [Salmonella enterica]|nr:hypothetical protein [Salmonella enterica]